MIRVSPPAEEGDDNATAAALSSEGSYSPNKSVRVAELDLALGLSIVIDISLSCGEVIAISLYRVRVNALSSL
ncbi:hypothetical protein F2Q70_00003440 [Brassica cretica]|uniref:Uncharacterized protein n=1 Tax=Brassica cretica TaxID=69181 RepID=A0A8S9IP87_BRACR|nr:hypothetical protein F2Q70_00003440 [Brassica cretica]